MSKAFSFTAPTSGIAAKPEFRPAELPGASILIIISALALAMLVFGILSGQPSGLPAI